MIRGFLNGATQCGRPHYRGERGEPGELKHLSSRRKRKQNVNPLVEAIEEGRAQTRCVTARRGFGPEQTGRRRAEQRMERRGDKGDSPVCEAVQGVRDPE